MMCAVIPKNILFNTHTELLSSEHLHNTVKNEIQLMQELHFLS
jgi:hypothetical protein